jgi:2-polyprenyl-3-methyl-5-hydroxy-6-metoxy-1,4-benzoquinol methylase
MINISELKQLPRKVTTDSFPGRRRQSDAPDGRVSSAPSGEDLRTCPLCDRAPTEIGARYSDFSGRFFHYGLCVGCDVGLVLDPREDYENLYDEAYYAGRGADQAVSYLDEMSDPHTVRNLEWNGLAGSLGPVRADKRILDFGCGLGGLPRLLRRRGWNAVGFEDGFAGDWMRQAGLPVLDELPDDESFDVIFAIEVFEHLVDPVGVLHRLRKQLAPGGRLIITTGNMARARAPLHTWSYASVPEVHVTFWSPRSWDSALSAADLVPVHPAGGISPQVTQYKILKALPDRLAPLARISPLWRPIGAFVDRRYGVSEFANGVAMSTQDTATERFLDGLTPPPGLTELPSLDDGWKDASGEVQPYLTYVDFSGAAWSDDLEDIHEESSRDHFMDIMTRRALCDAIALSTPRDGLVADLGCSTGYLLEDLDRAYPRAQLVGVDVVGAGLRKAHLSVPRAALLLADVRDLPVGDATVNAVVSANMLEHVDDDEAALREIRRILAPGGTAAMIVPFGHSLYDYYDRFLGHERRYRSGELAGKARGAGLEVVHVGHLGQLLYPVFWLVKKYNRRRYDGLRGDELRARVEHDIANTTNSRVGALACRIESWLTRHRITVPFGIREVVVVRRPADPA